MRIKEGQLEGLEDIIRKKFRLNYSSHYEAECFLYFFSFNTYFSVMHSAKDLYCHVSRNGMKDGYLVRIELLDMARNVQYLDPFYDLDVGLEDKVKETIKKNLPK